MQYVRRQHLLIGIFFIWVWSLGLLALCQPLAQWHVLRGATSPSPFPSIQTIFKDHWVSQCEAWFNQHFGFRNIFVRLDNQIYYSIFNEAPNRTDGTTLVVGRNQVLYERHYIRHALTPGHKSLQEISAQAQLIHTVQRKLLQKGIPLLLVIAPSKAEVYPEYIPAGRLGGRRLMDIQTDFERARPIFTQAGVDFLDGPDLFTQWKQAGRTDLFAPTGTHWSYDAVAEIWPLLRARLNPHLRHPIPDWRYRSRLRTQPKRDDRDLLGLLNLLSERSPHTVANPIPLPQTNTPQDRLPRILWVTDSFGWPLIDTLYEANATKPSEALYYFTSMYRLPRAKDGDPEVAQVASWPEFISHYDAIIVVWTEIAFDFDSWGFFNTLDRKL